MRSLLTVDEALSLIEAESHPLAPQEVPLRNTLGLVLADDIQSDVDSPPHDKALMDGYAVMSGDSSSELRVLEEVTAGAVPVHTVVPGTATRIMTGAPIPPGADAVVPVEQTESFEGVRVRIAQDQVAPGQHIMRCGASVRVGQVVAKRGVTMRALEVGICAEAGCAQVRTVPRPRVAVLPTGNELVPIDSRPTGGLIRNSNGPMLAAAVLESGYEAIELEVARDDRLSLAESISVALKADVALITGGMSAGTMDLVPSVLESLGVRKILHKVAIKPGKPLWFGVKTHDDGRRTLVFGLPGNPVSSFVCFQVFVRPALSALSGQGFAGLPQATARLAREVRHSGGRETYWPGRLEGGTVEPLAWRGSSDLAAWSAANALLRLPAGGIRLEVGQTIEILRLGK